MNKQQEKVLVAGLAGLVIAAAAAFAVQPANAGYARDAQAQISGVADRDRIEERDWSTLAKRSAFLP